jgi:hypothetical protein
MGLHSSLKLQGRWKAGKQSSRQVKGEERWTWTAECQEARGWLACCSLGK